MAENEKTEKPAEKTEKPASEKTVKAPTPAPWNQAAPSDQAADPSPVKTSVTPPPGAKAAYVPKTVAEHNAEVDALAEEMYPK